MQTGCYCNAAGVGLVEEWSAYPVVDLEMLNLWKSYRQATLLTSSLSVEHGYFKTVLWLSRGHIWHLYQAALLLPVRCADAVKDNCLWHSLRWLMGMQV